MGRQKALSSVFAAFNAQQTLFPLCSEREHHLFSFALQVSRVRFLILSYPRSLTIVQLQHNIEALHHEFHQAAQDDYPSSWLGQILPVYYRLYRRIPLLQHVYGLYRARLPICRKAGRKYDNHYLLPTIRWHLLRAKGIRGFSHRPTILSYNFLHSRESSCLI